MHNALLATFHNQPALISAGAESSFESFLTEAASTLSRIESAGDAPVMADDYWFSSDDWRSAYRPYIVKKGMLIIPVKGILLHDMAWQLGSWATGYVYLTKAFERGLADPEVKGIAWVHDSPGGHVAGNFDLCDKIYAARGVKPMRAFASESSYSASYSLSSSTDSITVSRTGGVGSIGVLTVHYDYSKALEKAGIAITFTKFGAHKTDGNSAEPLSKDVQKRIQARIDELGEIFVSTVARNRGMDAKAVRDTEASTFTATEATSNGLADKIGSLDDAIAVFAADLSLNNEDETMTEEEKKAAAMAATEARAEGFAAGAAETKTTAARAERERITSIMDSEEGKKRPIAAKAAAFGTEMSAADAIAFIAQLPEEKPAAVAVDPNAPKGKDGAAADFQTAMDNSEHPNAGSPGGDDEAKELPRHERALRGAGYGKLKAV